MWTSWRTTIFGISGLLVALGLIGSALIAQLDGDATTVPDWEAAVAAIAAALAGLGLTRARDDVVSTEETRSARRR